MTTSYRGITESVEDLLAKSHYMVAKCQVDGNLTFDGHRKTVEEADNESRCRSLCLRIERVLETCREEEIPALLEMYDLLHRIGYITPPSHIFLAKHRQRVYVAWRAGNHNIQESQIYSILKKAVNGRRLRVKMMKDWVGVLCTHKYFPDVTAHENYQRLAFVMQENIDTLISNCSMLSEESRGKNSKDLKWEWYHANKIGDTSLLSTSLLQSYRGFLASLFPMVLDYPSE